MELLSWLKDALLSPRDSTPMDFDKFGLHIWRCIFLRCDYNTLAHCYKTCHLFHDLLSQQQFWLSKCEYDDVAIPPLEWRRFILNHEEEEDLTEKYAFDYRTIYCRRPFGRNLVRPLLPTDTIDQLENLPYMSFEHGGDGLKLERVPEYAAEHPDIPMCFATSFGWCRRKYEIQLRDYGLDDWVMDNIRPKITVSEMQICRRDCAARYDIFVQLLTENEHLDRNVILPRFVRAEKTWAQWAGGVEWETVTFEFREYPVGIRRVVILTEGKDEQFWAGHYGPKFGNTQVVVSFPEEVKLHAEEDFPDPEKQFLGGRFVPPPARLNRRIGMLGFRPRVGRP